MDGSRREKRENLNGNRDMEMERMGVKRVTLEGEKCARNNFFFKFNYFDWEINIKNI